jgi:hypothetical protein
LPNHDIKGEADLENGRRLAALFILTPMTSFPILSVAFEENLSLTFMKGAEDGTEKHHF